MTRLRITVVGAMGGVGGGAPYIIAGAMVITNVQGGNTGDGRVIIAW